MKLKSHTKLVVSVLLLFLFILFYSWIGISYFSLNADVSRDLSELSNLWIGKMVWLGPLLRIGFPASPLYFYILFPALIISGGSAYSLVITQVFLSVFGLAILLVCQKNSYKLGNYLGMFFIGLSHWWIQSTIKPWNGNMYILWLLPALILLWNKKPLWLSSLLFGIAIAIHPASLLLSPILLYEAWRYKSKSLATKIISVVSGLILPWGPIIVFEIITKGFLTREWLNHKSTEMSIQPGTHNISSLVSLTGIPIVLLVLILLFSFTVATKKTKEWSWLLTPTIAFLLGISPLHQYYLLPVVAIFFIIVVQTLKEKVLGKVLLFLCIVIFAKNIAFTYKFDTTWPPTNRLEAISQVITTLENDMLIQKNSTYALISVIDAQNSTPQADDYRFLLRTKGYKALNISEYPSADYLVIFFENNQIDPENWQDWHSEYFGEKKLISSQKIHATQVLIYKRK